MPPRKKPITRKQIIQAIQAVGQKLRHVPNQAEFVRLSGIEVREIKRHFRWFPAAVLQAGLPWQGGRKIESADILQDWAEVSRRLGHFPTYREYGLEGRYGTTLIQKRFGGWKRMPEAYLRFVETGSLKEQWADVTEMVRQRARVVPAEYPRPVSESSEHRPAPLPQLLPVAVAGKKCVTVKMLGVFVAQITGIQFWSTGALFNRRVLPDRPLLGPPMQRTGMAYEPVNEMGVIMLFSMWAERLGFIIEFAQAKFPDCKAKMEVEPGRWQDVDVEFERYSANFKAHQHDARKCDLIICWKHNWPDCPEEIMVLELSRLVGSF
jgi:hypothetical protein